MECSSLPHCWLRILDIRSFFFVCFNFAPKNHGLVPQSELPLWFVCYTILNYALSAIASWCILMHNFVWASLHREALFATSFFLRPTKMVSSFLATIRSNGWLHRTGPFLRISFGFFFCFNESGSLTASTSGIGFASSSLEGPNLIPANPCRCLSFST